jgi:hypothetical protein
MAEQPIPRVTRADVERIIRREFLPAQYETVLALLAEYGREDWHREVDRVHLAILKLSAGDIDALRRELEAAKSDYRDVLAFAEYPACMRDGFNTFHLPTDEQQRIFDQDWAQYQDWLDRLA